MNDIEPDIDAMAPFSLSVVLISNKEFVCDVIKEFDLISTNFLAAIMAIYLDSFHTWNLDTFLVFTNHMRYPIAHYARNENM